MNFKEQLERKRAAAKTPEKKVISEMTSEEMDREQHRLAGEIRQLKEEGIALQREAVADANRRPRFLPNKRRKPPWK